MFRKSRTMNDEFNPYNIYIFLGIQGTMVGKASHISSFIVIVVYFFFLSQYTSTCTCTQSSRKIFDKKMAGRTW